MIKSKKNTILDSISKIIFNSSIFRIVFLIDLFFFSVAFCDSIARIIHIFLMVWGGIILIYDYIIKHMYKKVKYYKIILIFMSSCFVTVILHFKDNFYHNLLYLFTYLLCFFVFYGMHAEKNIIEKEKEMMTLFKIIFLLTSLISFIGKFKNST